MSIQILNGGLQMTIQAGPRNGRRHKGVPASGAADPVSHALANHLVGNPLDAASLEITLSGARLLFEENSLIAITGGEAEILHNSAHVQQHFSIFISSGDTLEIKALTKGARTYVAIAGGIIAQTWLGSPSTYLPAKLAGYHGRALIAGDRLQLSQKSRPWKLTHPLTTPDHLHPYIGGSWMLRALPGPDFDCLTPAAQTNLFAKRFQVSNRASRMGVELSRQKLALTSDGKLPSAAVFPGTLQCPPSGKPFLLMADAQTTGGYPRIAQIIRADRHMLGQLRPSDQIQLRRSTPDEAAQILKEKTELFRAWLGDTFQLR